MTIQNWNDVDKALRLIGEKEIALANIDGDMTLKINAVKEDAKQAAETIAIEKKELEKAVEGFCEANKAEFALKRSKELTFGEIGYRLVKSVSIPRVKTKLESLIKSLKVFGLSDCITYTEAVDKDKLTELKDEDLVKLGLKRTVKDSFRIKTNIEKVKEVG
ncbi:MAG: host-nuclease inhibitor Gam family protein [Deferribacterales bacterium]